MYTIMTLIPLLAMGCTVDHKNNEPDNTNEPEYAPVETNDTAEEEIDYSIDLNPTDAEIEYLNHWLDEQEEFVASLKWLPHYIHEQGELGICLRFEFENEQTVDGDMIEDLRNKIEERVWEWQRGLIGEENWIHDTVTPVRLFGIGVTPQVTLFNAPDVPVYENESAECPNECFRFTFKYDEAPTYADCEHPSLSHFDFNIWYSDFPFGAAGHGGDWGTRLDWELMLEEVYDDTPTVTDHELGHVAGLPDVYNYPFTLNGFDRPDAIMSTDETLQPFDYLMLRKVWELGWAQHYSEE